MLHTQTYIQLVLVGGIMQDLLLLEHSGLA